MRHIIPRVRGLVVDPYDSGLIARRDPENAVIGGRSAPLVQTGRILPIETDGVAGDHGELKAPYLAVGIPSSPIEMNLVPRRVSFDGAARKPHLGGAVIAA